MAELIQKYLSQIQKKLRSKKVPQAFVDEFIDNLEEQLLSMLEEIRLQEPGLAFDDAQVTVLSNCEAVDTVVDRVLQQYHSVDLIPSLETKELPSELQFLYPLESFFLKLAKRLDSSLSTLTKSIHRFQAWYKRNENPTLTAPFYLGLLFFSLSFLAILFFLMPSFYQVTVFPSNKTYYFFGGSHYNVNIPSYITQDPSISGLAVTSVSQYLQAILSTVVFFSIFFHLGWTRPFRFSSVTGFLTSLLITLFITLLSSDGRLSEITSYTTDKGWVAYTPDWFYTYIPSSNEYIVFFLKYTIIQVFLLFFSSIFFLILLGSFFKNLKTKNFPQPYTISVGKNLTQVILFLGFLGLSFIIPQNYQELRHSDLEYPIPGRELPVFYKFRVWPEGVSTVQHLLTHKITFPQFGNMSFIWDAIFQLEFSVNSSVELDLNSSSQLSA